MAYTRGLRPSRPESLGDFLDTEFLKLQQALADVSTGTVGPSEVRTVTTSGSYASDDLLVKVNATGGAVTITLPSPDEGVVCNVKKIDASANAVIVASAALIDGAASVNTTIQWESLSFAADGTTWSII